MSSTKSSVDFLVFGLTSSGLLLQRLTGCSVSVWIYIDNILVPVCGVLPAKKKKKSFEIKSITKQFGYFLFCFTDLSASINPPHW